MLLVVSPNLAIDRILEVEELHVGEVQRSRKVITQPGGKGSNVARVFRQLGGEVTLLGFAGRQNSERIREPLRSMGIQVDAIDGHDGERRVCTIILEKTSQRHPTVINEESRPIDPQAIREFEARFDQVLGSAQFVFFTGSLAQGLPMESYARLIRKAAGKGIRTAIDATGAVLRRGLEAGPTLAKANLEELSSALGSLGREPSEISHTLRSSSDHLATQTIVTLGERGAVFVSGETAWHVTPPRLSHVNPIGTGDSFAAAYLKAIMAGEAVDDALRFATAVAASDAATVEPGLIIPGEIPSLVSSTSAVPVHHL
jgi:1-phosphofructokinase family hexose kinase